MRVHRTTRLAWTQAEDDQIRALYLTTEHAVIGVLIDRTEVAVKNRCYRLHLTKKHDWSEDDLAILTEFYMSHQGKAFELDDLVQKLGRHRSTIAGKAGDLGLTDRGRPTTKAHWQALNTGREAKFARDGHPRGALGMQFSAEAKAKISVASKRAWLAMTPLDRELRAVKRNRTMLEQYGSGNPGGRGHNAYSRCRYGRREDLGNLFFRSSWEANYARYLNFLKAQGQIAEWEYEPHTFIFHGEIRGVISYLPDFRVTALDGTQVYHEVKGWETSKDRTKWTRMKKHYPDVVIRIVDQTIYKALARQCAGLIPYWEVPE